MTDLIFATGNKHKADELRKVIQNVNILTLKDINFSGEIIENGKTFLDNALIKCQTVYNATHKPVIADDSGLSVDQLGGAPGVFSARYGQPNFDDKQRYEYLLSQLDYNKPLDASFICCLILYVTPGRIYSVQEEVRGVITRTPKGTNGFGYDPIFYIPSLDKTYAELTDNEKNAISHRGKAVSVMNEIINKIF